MLDVLPYQAFERDAFIRTAEVSLAVGSRREFFMWTRLHLHRFVPHDMVMCHVTSLHSGKPSAEVFHGIPLDPDLHNGLCRSPSPLWQALHDGWRQGGRRAIGVGLDGVAPCDAVRGLTAAGFDMLYVHGVDASSFMRPEALFAFGSGPGVSDVDADALRAGLELWMPHLHACAVRALTSGTEPLASPARRSASGGVSSASFSSGGNPVPLTAREVQVLTAVRAAKRTVDIGAELGISPLTVKNHIRKIMSKLGARSRTHAVAEAMARQIIS